MDIFPDLQLSTFIIGSWRVEENKDNKSYVELYTFDKSGDFKWLRVPSESKWQASLETVIGNLEFTGNWTVAGGLLSLWFKDMPQALWFVRMKMKLAAKVSQAFSGPSQYHINIVSDSELTLETPNSNTTSVLRLYRIP